MPAGKEGELMLRAALTTICSEAVAICPAASVARTVKLELPGVVGVPERVPLADKDTPPGKDPLDKAHV